MIPFVGPSYALKIKRQDVQRCVNLMPTPVESGSGKSAVYLAPVPGLSRLDGVVTLPGPAVFMDDFVSHSCNYGFFQQPTAGGFILVTDSFGADRDASFTSPQGWYLKLVVVNNSGVIVSTVTSSTYVTVGVMQTYFYNGMIYAGAVIEIATGARHLIKINPDTLVVTKVYEHTTHLWKIFDLIADPSKVMMNNDRVVDTFEFFVVDLETGTLAQTVSLPAAIESYVVSHVTQQTIGGNWFVGSNRDAFVKRCNYLTGEVLAQYSAPDLFGLGSSLHMVQRAGSYVLLFARQSGDLERYRVGVFNTTTNLFENYGEMIGKPHELNLPIYDPVRNTVYFVTTEETYTPLGVPGQVRVYGYSLDTFSIEYDVGLADLGYAPGQEIGVGTANFTGSFDSAGNLYVSVFTGVVPSGGFNNEQYKVFKLTPP